MKEQTFIGRGIYTLSEAARLTKVPRSRIHRWTAGYAHDYQGESRWTDPVVKSDLPKIQGVPAIDFSDLIEIRFLNAFRNCGVGWKALRIASERAMELIKQRRPFSSKIFKTDGRTILAEITTDIGDKVLLDLVKNQYAFEKIIKPFLYAGIEFNKSNEPERWWPLGINRSVVIDPHRVFGSPIVNMGGIPTGILYRAVSTEKSVDFVADWFNVSPHEIRDAIKFERQLAA
jgi:uncharacterized protein (DUF433 family)